MMLAYQIVPGERVRSAGWVLPCAFEFLGLGEG